MVGPKRLPDNEKGIFSPFLCINPALALLFIAVAATE
jgi:hypothetical protein